MADNPASAVARHIGLEDATAPPAALLNDVARNAVVTSGVAFGEILLSLAAIYLKLPALGLIAGHLALVGLLALWLRARIGAGADTTVPVIVLLVTAVTGPVGPILCLGALADIGRARSKKALLQAWYDRISLAAEIDPVTRLCEDVESGRTIDTDAPVPPSFAFIIDHGSMNQRQTALGLIARKFDPRFACALARALRSPEPVIRVQAAAVAVRVKAGLKTRVREGLAGLAEAQKTPRTAVQLAAVLDDYVRSGLLDDGDRLRCQAAAARLTRGLTGQSQLDLDAGTPRQAGIIEAGLLNSGRFSAFRTARRIRAIVRNRSYRVRRLGSRTDGPPVRTADRP